MVQSRPIRGMMVQSTPKGGMMVKVCRGSLSLPYRSKHTARDSISCIAAHVVVCVNLHPATIGADAI